MRRRRAPPPGPGGLREITGIRQHPGERERRWFTCDAMDLYVWYERTEITAFELCYDKPHRQRSLRWDHGRGFRHDRIDDGESTPLRNATPIAVPDGECDRAGLARRFAALADDVDPAVRAFVLALLAAPG